MERETKKEKELWIERMVKKKKNSMIKWISIYQTGLKELKSQKQTEWLKNEEDICIMQTIAINLVWEQMLADDFMEYKKYN